MSSRKKRAFGLHHGLHTSFLQVEMDDICGERLDDNIVKDFGHLNSVFSFPRGHWILGILNIGRRKLEMTTSNNFGKGRTLLTMKV